MSSIRSRLSVFHGFELIQHQAGESPVSAEFFNELRGWERGSHDRAPGRHSVCGGVAELEEDKNRSSQLVVNVDRGHALKEQVFTSANMQFAPRLPDGNDSTAPTTAVLEESSRWWQAQSRWCRCA